MRRGSRGMELDKELIQFRTDVIEKNLKLIGEIAKEGHEKFKKSFRDEMAAKHALLESIEACLDIANHIIATKGFRRPVDYKDVFLVLKENKIINDKLSLKLQSMAKFRNILVHRYAEIESKRLFKIMTRDVRDIKEFIKTILKYIK